MSLGHQASAKTQQTNAFYVVHLAVSLVPHLPQVSWTPNLRFWNSLSLVWNGYQVEINHILLSCWYQFSIGYPVPNAPSDLKCRFKISLLFSSSRSPLSFAASLRAGKHRQGGQIDNWNHSFPEYCTEWMEWMLHRKLSSSQAQLCKTTCLAAA